MTREGGLGGFGDIRYSGEGFRSEYDQWSVASNSCVITLITICQITKKNSSLSNNLKCF